MCSGVFMTSCGHSHPLPVPCPGPQGPGDALSTLHRWLARGPCGGAMVSPWFGFLAESRCAQLCRGCVPASPALPAWVPRLSVFPRLDTEVQRGHPGPLRRACRGAAPPSSAWSPKTSGTSCGLACVTLRLSAGPLVCPLVAPGPLLPEGVVFLPPPGPGPPGALNGPTQENNQAHIPHSLPLIGREWGKRVPRPEGGSPRGLVLLLKGPLWCPWLVPAPPHTVPWTPRGARTDALQVRPPQAGGGGARRVLSAVPPRPAWVGDCGERGPGEVRPAGRAAGVWLVGRSPAGFFLLEESGACTNPGCQDASGSEFDLVLRPRACDGVQAPEEVG